MQVDKKVSFSNANHVSQNYTFALYIFMCIVDFILWLMIGLYINYVIPSEFGLTKHPCFCIKWKWRHRQRDNDVAQHDETDDSLINSDIDENKDLEDLGTPTDVGYRFMQIVNANTNNGREAELISAQKGQKELQDYYLLEYRVKLGEDLYRHNLASVATKNGKLYTFNISSTESRWQKVQQLFTTVAKSFTVS